MEKVIYTLPDGIKIKEFTLQNLNGVTVKILNYGGIITSIQVPDRNGNTTDILLGFDSFEPYIKNPPYFGAIIGRVTNRISGSKFKIDGKTYHINSKFKDYTLHGGITGFDKKIWNSKPYKIDGESGVELSYLSPDGEEGFPGNLKTRIIYRLTDQNEFYTEYFATTDRTTHVNLTNHAYFNLSGKETIYNHEALILADKITETDHNILSTGELIEVEDTPFDFRKMHAIGDRINETDVGYDHCYVFDKAINNLAPAAKVYEPNSGRILEVFTTYPSIQFYTGNYLEGTIGKKGRVYQNHEAFCLETQNLPDACNRPEFPSTILTPDDIYLHVTIMRFGVAE